MNQHVHLVILLLCYGTILYGIIESKSPNRILALCIGFGGIFLYPIVTELIMNIIAKFRRESKEDHDTKHREIINKKIPICYSDQYNITACGLEKLHPFDSCKYERVFTGLKQKNLFNESLIHTPSIPYRSTLLEVMSPWYLLCLNYSLYISKCVELPLCFIPSEFFRYRLLNPMMIATQGSIDGVCFAIRHGWAINLSGGYHHATCSSGGGFCIYPDITLALHNLRKWHPEYKKLMIIDLDAHQGNGHERDFIGDTNTYIVDCYNKDIYPGDYQARKGISKEIIAHYNQSDEEYLYSVQEGIGSSIREFVPEFIIYNAGTDCMSGDPLGNLNLSPSGVIKRDELVFSFAFENRIPILMVLSGGYQKSNAPVIADSIKNLDDKFQIFQKLSPVSC